MNMFISLISRDFVHDGKTKDFNQRINIHQYGHGSLSSQPEQPEHLQPFSHMCGFDGNEKDDVLHRTKMEGIN